MKQELILEFEENINEYINLDNKLTPIVQYYGGKNNLVNDLLKILPDINSYASYIEPFAGGCSLFFAKPLSKYNYINEINSEITNMYIQMQMHKEEFIKCCEYLSHSQILHRLKRKYNLLKSNFTKAVILFYIISTSYNHKIYGGYAVSLSRNHAKYYIDKIKELDEKIEKLKNAHIFNKDAIEIIKTLDNKNSLFYIDPPYPETEQGHYKGYTYNQFDELIDYLKNKIKGRFILSCYPKNIDKYRPLPADFTEIKLKKVLGAFRVKSINGIMPRPYKEELIIKNY